MTKPRRLEQTRRPPHGRARGLVSGRTSGSRIDAESYRPADDLKHVVAACWTGSWDLRGQAPHVTEMLGDPCVHLVFEDGSAGPSSRLVGVWTRLWKRTLCEQGRVRGLKLKPGAVRAIWDRPAAELSNRIMPLTDLVDDAAGLQQQVLAPTDEAEAFAALETWMRDRIQTVDLEPTRAAVELVERVAASPDITTAAQLADHAGCSVRALQRLFRDHVGATPKWVIRRNRLQEAALRIESGQAPTLATLAADLGYADQAHLARDFKSVVGKSPSEFAATVWR